MGEGIPKGILEITQSTLTGEFHEKDHDRFDGNVRILGCFFRKRRSNG
jgi:hypothetical protein